MARGRPRVRLHTCAHTHYLFSPLLPHDICTASASDSNLFSECVDHNICSSLSEGIYTCQGHACSCSPPMRCSSQWTPASWPLASLSLPAPGEMPWTCRAALMTCRAPGPSPMASASAASVATTDGQPCSSCVAWSTASRACKYSSSQPENHIMMLPCSIAAMCILRD